jgi:hypothetical protein
VRFGPKLERRQMVLFRAVDIGAELFAISAACVRARMLEIDGQVEAVTLADAFCREARERIRVSFAQLFGPNDEAVYKVAAQVLRGEHEWVEQGIVGLPPWEPKPRASPARAPGRREAAVAGD